MSETVNVSGIGAHTHQRRPEARHFKAQIGRFDDPKARAVIDDLTRWIEHRFAQERQQRLSCHVYLRTLPPTAPFSSNLTRAR